jgi:type VI secretion system protein ImpG
VSGGGAATRTTGTLRAATGGGGSTRDELLLYYERELTYLRRLGAEFGARYPKVAARLQLEEAKCDDPHVERLLEGVAFLNARLHRRLDEDLPELSEALLEVLHPLHVRPVPSMSIVEVELDRELGALPGGFRVPRGAELRSRPVQGMPCRFRTSYDTVLWPATVAAAEWTGAQQAGAGVRLANVVGAVRLELRALPGVRFGQVTLDDLRVHLSGDALVADTLYELLINNTARVVVRDPDQPERAPQLLEASAVRAVGFEDEEALLPLPRRVLAGHRLLQELFVLPQKFQFVDLVGLGGALRALDCGPRAEVALLMSPFERAERRAVLELGLSASAVRLGCTPVVNLFAQTAEPILLSERQLEYLVIPDVRRRLEVEAWAIDGVSAFTPGGDAARPLAPLYAHRHGVDEHGRVFWHATRRASGWRTDRGADLFISFADLSGAVRAPDHEVVSCALTCFNGDLPSQLPFGTDASGDFELVSGGPVRRVRCLVKPTAVVQPALGKALLWRLVSALSLNHLSLVDDGRDALQELLRLHNTGNGAAGERQILGLAGVRSAPAFARVVGEHGAAFARGRRVELTLDEEQYPGGGAFLMASVLERLLALAASMNSFTQLAVYTRQRRGVLREWEPRSGRRTLV